MKTINKLLFLFLLFTGFQDIIAQESCPAGYEMRKIKCDGKISERCVPSNYACHICWTVEYENCNGTHGAAFFDNYNQAYSEAEEKKQETEKLNTKMGKCWLSTGNYTIYMTDSHFCGTLNGDAKVREDLKNKVTGFLRRYFNEISNYRQMISNNMYRPGAVTREYSQVLDDSERNARQLEQDLSLLNDKNLEEFEREFEKVQKEETNLKTTFTNYQNSISSQSNTQNNSYNSSSNIGNTQTAKPSTTTTYSTGSTNNAQTQTANAIKNYWNQYDRKKEAIEQNYQAQSQMMTSLGNTGMNLISQIMDKSAENERRQREMQQALEQMRAQDKQALDIKNNLISLMKGFDNDMVSNYNIKKSPTTISPSDNYSFIYFVSYVHDFKFDITNDHIHNPYPTIYKNDYTMKIYKLYPNQDGTWMYMSDILNKIQFKESEDAEGSKSILYGYYTNINDPLQLINQVSGKVKSEFSNYNEIFKLNLNTSVDPIEINSKNTGTNSSSPSKTNSQDFWKQ